ADFIDAVDGARRACRGHGDAGADGGLVAFGSDEAEEDAVVGVLRLIQEERGRGADVPDDDIEIAVVVDIPEGRAAERLERAVVEAGVGGDIGEFGFAVVTEEQDGLDVAGVGWQGVDERSEVSVGNKEVVPAVVIEVGETYAPASHIAVDATEAGD